MKMYAITEKQIEELKKHLENLNTLPAEVNNSINETIWAEGSDIHIEGIKESVAELMADSVAKIKYLIEDMEAQKLTETKEALKNADNL